jgi:UDP-N-acetyl-2-amino-2-deoxyglucuronate dehydrogenase
MGRDNLRFAIVGCGVIAPMHAAALAGTDGAELAVVVDDVAEAAAHRGAEFGVEHTTDLDATLARDDIDAVAVCTPSGLHGAVGARAAGAGKQVLVEKPIDITLEAADRLIATARRAGVTLGVVSQQRWNPGVRQLQQLIRDGRLGRLVLGDAIIKWYRSQAYYDSGEWRGTWALDGGGCLMNQGVHYVDLLQWLMGPVETVVAHTRTATHERIEVEDVAQALLTFRGGAVGTLQGSTSVYPGLPERIEVAGTAGTAIITKGALTFCQLVDGSADAPAEPDEPEGGSTDPAAIGSRLHLAQYRDYVAAVREGRDPLVSGEEGRKPLEIILAVYESARTGAPVTLGAQEHAPR